MHQAKGAYAIDEFAYKEDMTKWSPEVSQILRAHSMGFTLEEFNHYMLDSSRGYSGTQVFKPKGSDTVVRMDEKDVVKQYTQDYTKYTREDIDEMNRQDFQHLQADLTAAGRSKDMYNPGFTRNAGAQKSSITTNTQKNVVSKAVEQRQSVDAQIAAVR